jgi:hypothetical protein
MTSQSGDSPMSHKTRYTIISTPILDPKVYPEANVTHHYTHCNHTSPPKTRPLNVQPMLIYSSSTSGFPKSTLLGRCYDCDFEYRRKQETVVLQKHHKTSMVLQSRLIAARERLETAQTEAQLDQGNINGVVAETNTLVDRREVEVKAVWKGFSKRWGPGTLGVQEGLEGGRMDVNWERPEKR